MRNIIFTRIDERLIHGQVATSWLKVTSPDTILVIDDATAKNAFSTRILRAATPKGYDLKVMTLEDAKTYLKEETEGEKVFVLTKVPAPLLKLIQSGVHFNEIILGNMGGGAGRKRFNKNVNATDQEVQDLKDIVELGTPVYAQMVPTDSKVDIKKMF